MANFFGTAGEDNFLGAEGDDFILGNEGTDTLNGDASYGILRDGVYDGVYSAITNQSGSNLSFTNYVWGNDYIDGGDGRDFIYGEARNVGIASSSGSADSILTLGNDTLFGGAGDDEIVGEGFISVSRTASSSSQGADENVTDVILITGADVLFGESGNDRLYGDGVNSSLSFGNNIQSGEAGTTSIEFAGDLLDGGDGNDALFGDSFNVFFYYGAEDAEMTARGGNDTLRGGSGNDVLIGETQTLADGSANWQTGVPEQNFFAGDDLLLGGDGADVLIGDVQTIKLQYGDSTVINGDDTLVGGAGSDRLYGDSINLLQVSGTYETGADVFVFEEGSGSDTIYDFETGKDLIDVSALGYTSFEDVSQFFTTNAVTGDLIIDWDATAVVQDQVTVLGVSTLSETDFVFA